MAAREIMAQPLTAEAFAPYGEVLEAGGAHRLINQGLCARHHDMARLDFGADCGGQGGISIFKAAPRALPYRLDMIERHPEGSQAFLPMSEAPFLVVVSDGPEVPPLAFITNGAQGVNLHRGTWHGVLTPLAAPGLFAVVDRIGPSPNLEEHVFAAPWLILGPES